METRRRQRPTLRDAMVLIAIVALILGLLGRFREDWGTVAGFLMAAVVVVLPLHLAIEGNRRDGRSSRTGGDDESG